MVLTTHPLEILGPWEKGYVLDNHLLWSEYAGTYESGHARFNKERSEVGQHLFQFKYRRDNAAAIHLIDTAAAFLRLQDWPIEFVVPVPPSRFRFRSPPTTRLARGIGKSLKIQMSTRCVRKVKKTSEMKKLASSAQRKLALADAFRASRRKAKGRTVLIIDDVYRSGMTISAIAKLLYIEADVRGVYVLAFTRTRSQ